MQYGRQVNPAVFLLTAVILVCVVGFAAAQQVDLAQLNLYLPLNNSFADYSQANVFSITNPLPPEWITNCNNALSPYAYCAYADPNNVTNQYLNMSGPTINANFTLSFWMNASNNGNLPLVNYPRIFYIDNTAHNQALLWHMANGNQFFDQVTGNSGSACSSYACLNNSGINNTWNFYSMECNYGGDIDVYVNGNTTPGYVMDLPGYCQAGTQAFNYLRFFQTTANPTSANQFYGEMQEISFYNSTLNTTDLQQLYTNGGDPFTTTTTTTTTSTSTTTTLMAGNFTNVFSVYNKPFVVQNQSQSMDSQGFGLLNGLLTIFEIVVGFIIIMMVLGMILEVSEMLNEKRFQ